MPEKPASDKDLYAGWTNEQLVHRATRTYGAAGEGASAELTKRMIVATNDLRAELVTSGKTLNRYTRWLIILTVVIVALTFALVGREFGWF